MKMNVYGTLLVFGILFLGGSLASANEVVINNGFETQDWQYWNTSGTLPTNEMSVTLFDMTPGFASWCYNLITYTGVTGGLIQQVYVQQGVTYTVSAEFAYETC